MHLKKSEEEQIRRESSGISSDFNPTPPLPPVSLYQKHPQFSQILHSSPRHPSSASSSVNSPTLEILIDDQNKQEQEENEPFPLKHTLFKRPHIQQQSSGCLTKNPTLSKALDEYGVSAHNPHAKTNLFHNGARRFLSHFHQLPLRVHLVLSLPFLYFMVTYPSRSFILDFLFAFAFSYVVLSSLKLTVPRLPTIRLFLVRSLPVKIRKKDHVCQPHLPVVWSIGSAKTVDENVRSLSGSHVQDYSNGDVYEGEFHEGKFSGGGVYYYHMSGRFEGDWIDGKHDGYGVETWTMGSRYRGQYRQGLRHGLGVYRFYTGDMYAGEWSNGQSNGWGMHTCADGSQYEGEFKWGVKHGLGHYHFRNGDRYAGEYFADKIHGFGVYYFANGHRYEGAWHEGRRQGLGTYTFRNGDTQSGHWQNGILGVPSTQSTTYPVSAVAVDHSKVLDIVQEARRAAEKAQAATKLDERVNKAVTAAVLAANAARVAAVKAVQKRMYRPKRK